MMQMGAYISTLGLFSWSVNLQLFWSVGFALAIAAIGPLLMLLQVEGELKKRFPKK